MELKSFFIVTALLLAFAMPAAGAMQVVSTTSVLQDPIQYIGGSNVESICVSDPSICPHMQGDVVNARIQQNRDFIMNADLYVAHNNTGDRGIVMPKIDELVQANGGEKISWVTPGNPHMEWNCPESAKVLAGMVEEWLISADPDNTTYYENGYTSYCRMIDETDLSGDETAKISGQDAVVIVWQREAVEDWLGLNVVNIYAPDFYKGGKYTAVKLVGDIKSNPDKYRNVSYVIENMQSGELGKGVEEALHDQGIEAKRVIFTNFPKSVDGVDTIPDVLNYNKGLVTPAEDHPAGGIPETVPTQKSPVSFITVLSALCLGMIIAVKRH